MGFKRLGLPVGATQRARSLRKTMTRAERSLWNALRITFPDQHWRKQVPLGPYIVDVCSHAARLIIEVDGGQHATATAYDAARTRFLVGEGYRVVRFWNNDITANLDGAIATIATDLSLPALELAQ